MRRLRHFNPHICRRHVQAASTPRFCAVFATIIASMTAFNALVDAEPKGDPSTNGADSDAFQFQLEERAFSIGIASTFTNVGDVTQNVGDFLGGGAVGDFNNDGWQDLFVLSGGASPDKLFINNRDGTFTNRAGQWGLAARHVGAGVAVGDYNNDGFLDLYVTSFGPTETAPALGHHKLYQNTGENSFFDTAAAAGVNLIASTMIDKPGGFGSAFGDYDLDGDLDLFVANWLAAGARPITSKLFRNEGDGTFTDVTIPSGVADGLLLRGFSPRFVDMNGDRYPELLIAADGKTSRYLVNNHDGTFSNRTLASGAGHDQFGMGQTVADFNNDGALDWYVTSIYDESGGREGNKLYLNAGDDRFFETASFAQADNGGWGWGVISIDLNHDGFTDIVGANGSHRSGGLWIEDPAYVLLNNGDATFTHAANDVGFIHTGQGRGLINFDADNDGDQDIVMFCYNEGLTYFENETVQSGANWLRIFLDTSHDSSLAPNGFGAIVRARIGAATQTACIDGGCNYLSQSELSAHFGLANAPEVDELTIEWANGEITTLRDVPANRTLTISAGVPSIIGDLDYDNRVNAVDLATLLARWGANESSADLTGNGRVDAADLAALLGAWGRP